ncbi:hypothetical protein D3C79_558390 [compost metagenome]
MRRGSVNGIGQGLHGDLTTTGAVCISSLPNATQGGGRAVLRLGDKTTPCPQCGKIGVIVDSLPAMRWMGIATVLDGAGIHCGCPTGRNRLIAPMSHGVTPQSARRAAQPAFSTVTRSSVAPPQSAFSPSSNPTPAVFNSPGAQEPGFYVVPKSMTREALETTLFPTRDPAVMSKFQVLNPNLGDVKAGSMVVLSDPNNFQCTREEALLMEAAAKTNEALKPLSPEEADFMVRHRDEIETFLAQGSTAIGIGEAVFSRNLASVKDVLSEIEALHKRSFETNGHLRSPEFFAERRRLLAQLNANLTAMTRKGIGFPDHPDLKSALGISSRSLVHQWTQGGATGQIPGYATHIEGVSRAAKVVKYGGWIGTALGGGASYLKVQDVCTAGNAEACEKIKFTETGSFIGGVGGGAATGAFLTGSTVGALCVALGVPTGGMATLVCGIVAVGVGSVTGGALGGVIGELGGEVIYEVVK